MFDIRDVDSIDDTSDGLAKSVPRYPLILLTCLVLGSLLLQSTQTSRWHIDTTRPGICELGKFGLCIKLGGLLVLAIFELLKLLDRHTSRKVSFTFRTSYRICIADFWGIYKTGSRGRRERPATGGRWLLIFSSARPRPNSTMSFVVNSEKKQYLTDLFLL